MRIKYIMVLFFAVLFAGCGKIKELYKIDTEKVATVIESDNNMGHLDFIKLGDGKIFVVFTEHNERSAESEILMCKSKSGIAGWSKPGVLVKSGWKCYNPVVCRLKDGLVIIVFNQSRRDDKKGSDIPIGIFLIESFDNGVTFTAPRMIPAGEKSSLNVSGGILEAENGDLFVGVSAASGDVASYVGALLSEDRGETWRRVDIFSGDSTDSFNLENPSIIETGEKDFLCLMQSRDSQGFIYESISKDGGHTWSLPFNTGMEGTFPGIVKTGSGSMFAVFQDMWPKGISIIRSYNNGVTWEDERPLKNAQGNCMYPIVKSFDDKIYIAFSQDIQKNKHGIRIIIRKNTLLKSPSGLSASVDHNKYVHLRWNATQGADYYAVYRDTSDSFDSLLTRKRFATVFKSSYIDESVKQGQDYFYSITQVIGRGKLIIGTGMESRPSKSVKVVAEKGSY
ncbi:exo-alpha-sialidase [bacterium]|nr:exo-alpha-sialidase [bacterium]